MTTPERKGKRSDQQNDVDLRLCLDALGSEDLSARITAVEFLGQLGRMAQPAIGRLTDLLFQPPRSPKPKLLPQCENLLRATVSALAKIEGASKVLVPRILSDLASPASGTRRRAARALSQLGDQTPAILEEAGMARVLQAAIQLAEQSDEDVAVRCEMIDALGNFGVAARKAVEELLHDREGAVRQSALMVLAKYDDEQSGRLIAEHLSGESDESVWYWVSETFQQSCSHFDSLAGSMVPVLIKALGNRAPSIRACAAFTLSKFGTEAGPAAHRLIELLRDADPHVRHGAVTAIAGIGELANQAVPALIEARSDEDPVVAEAADMALADIDPRAHSSVILNEASSSLPGKASEALPIAIRLGDGEYQVGNGAPFRLTEIQDTVLAALVFLGTADKDQLNGKAGRDDSPRVLKRIRGGYPQLAPYIILPGGKGRGGYRTTIRQA